MNELRCLLLASVCLSSLPVLGAEEKPAGEKQEPEASKSQPVSFHKDLRPILQKRCQGCHQPAKAGGKIVLTSYSELMGAGPEDDEPVVVPGKPDESLLLVEITPDGDDPPNMPKDAEPLSAVEIELFRRWIAEGAKDDSPPSSSVRYTRENPPVYQLPPVLTCLDFSPDSSLLAVSGYNEVLLHRADGPQAAGSAPVARLVGLSARIERVVFSADGKYLAVAAGSPCVQGELQVWDVEKRKLRLSVPTTFDTIYGTCWSHDDKLIAYGCADHSVRAIDVKTGKQVLFQGAHNDWVLGTAFSKDSSHLVSVGRDRSAKLIMVKTEQFIDNITSITPGALKGGILTIQRHPKEDHILVAGADGEPKTFRIYREKARKIGDDYNRLLTFGPLPGRVFSCEFNSDGTRVVAGSSYNRAGAVHVYENNPDEKRKTHGKLAWKLDFPDSIYSVAFRPDGKVVAAGGFAGKVRLIDAVKGEVIKEFVPVPLALEL